jgi:putative transposase
MYDVMEALTMTRPLDGISFQTYFRRLGLQPEAQELLRQVRSSPPTRTPGSRAGNMPVWYPSKKMQCIIKAESAKVEFAFLLEAEHSDEVIEFWDQPPPIPLEYHDKRNHLQRPLHTADYFVFRSDSAGWEECKPVEKLMQFAHQGSKRYVLDEKGQWRCPPGEAFAAQYGLTYRVRASDQINWAAQDNWLYLEDYYQSLEKLVVPEAELETLLQLVEDYPGIPLSELRTAASPISSDRINIAIASYALYVDLGAHRLTEPSCTPVWRSREMARVHRHQGEGAVDRGLDAHPVVIEQGSRVLWDGKPWRIAVGQTELTLICEEGGAPFPLARSTFDALVHDGKIVGARTDTRSRITREGEARLDSAREVDLATAEFRNRVINPDQYGDDEQVQIAVRAATIPARTKRYWRHLYQDAETRYGSGYIGLIPHFTNSGGTRKMAPEVLNLVEEVLTTHYDTVTRKPKRGAYGEYLKQSEQKKLEAVSQRTFYTLAKRHKPVYEQVLVRAGARAAYPFKDYHRPSEKTIHRHGNYAWAMAHIDHLEVDLELCDSETGQPMGKCWLTLMILSHPRRIVAFYLTFDPPSYRSCMMVMRLCVKRYGRLPTAITVDGGPEFRSVYFEQLLALYRVRKHQRPSAEPRFGSPLERLFGTMDTTFIYHLLGNTQATKQPRTMTKATDPSRHAVWTLASLADRVQQWADEEYDTMRHPALRQSPREAYEQSLKRDGERDHKRIPYDDVFVKATFPTTRKGTALVQPGIGVRMNYLDYWCDEMRDRDVERTVVAVRYDPFDATVGYARIRGRWRKCVCVADELVGCSERELQLLSAELREHYRITYGKAQVEITQKQLADFRRVNTAKEAILRQQRNDRETRAALHVLEGGRGKHAAVLAPHGSLAEEAEQHAPNRNPQRGPSSTSPRHPVGDGDTLRVLRRLR